MDLVRVTVSSVVWMMKARVVRGGGISDVVEIEFQVYPSRPPPATRGIPDISPPPSVRLLAGECGATPSHQQHHYIHRAPTVHQQHGLLFR
jgi:hypothetical protein